MVKVDTSGTNISHLFFVDDATDTEWRECWKSVTRFSNDVGMRFGETKCAYQTIERGKRKAQNKNQSINGQKIQEIQERGRYKYPGIDESIGIIGPLNKDRVARVKWV